MDCIFCKIISGEIPCHKVYEDEFCVAFLDIRPVNKGHTLIVPKKHSEDFLNTDMETLKEMSRVAQKVATAVLKATSAEGFNININNGKVAGQVVFHLHWHIVPRFADDGRKLWPGGEYKEGEAEMLVEKIKEHL
jgi:histidine triad (HIT) family protein